MVTNDFQARTRDQRTCVITRNSHIAQGAHIYPFKLAPGSTADMQKVNYFWRILYSFWDHARVPEFEAQVFTKGTEICGNYMCLDPTAHCYWDQARFALKPLTVAADKRSMEVQFFWMSKYKFKEEQDLLEVPNLPPDLTHREAEACLYNSQLDKVVCSGDIITLRTHDPEGFPLPDCRLLELQWILHRLASLRGASEELSNDNYKDDGSFRVPAWLRFGRSAGINDENKGEDDRAEGRLPSWLQFGGRIDDEEEVEEDDRAEDRLPSWLQFGGRIDDEEEVEDVPELQHSSSVPPGGSSSVPDVPVGQHEPPPAASKVPEESHVIAEGANDDMIS